MPEMLWSLSFIQSQGYECECIAMYQDNISSQLLIKNGKMSSGKKTKHIKSKFFFIKDRVDGGEIKVIDCPTEEMWADIMTKPLQGMAFRTMRAELMNCPVNYDEDEELEADYIKSRDSNMRTGTQTAAKRAASTTPQECVGNKRFRTTATDRPVGRRNARLGGARVRWRVGVGDGSKKRGRE